MVGSAMQMGLARFGSFEFDPGIGELRCDGAKVSLQDQPARILGILLQGAGQVVTREDLREALWSADTFVDFDRSLNTAIRKLRAALDDSADAPRYVETLAQHGYRFVAPVEWVRADGRAGPGLPRSNRVWWVLGIASSWSCWSSASGLGPVSPRSLPAPSPPSPCFHSKTPSRKLST